MDLRGKVIAITGSSQGFGKALAKAFTEAGSKVIISSNDQKSLSITASELNLDSYLCNVAFHEQLQTF